MGRIKDNSGLTLLELLLSITILSIIVVGLNRIPSAALSAYTQSKEKQGLLLQGRFALDRMVMFAQQTDRIFHPGSPLGEEILSVSERVVDFYRKDTHGYVSKGDGFLDADNDGDGLVNEGGADPPEPVTFSLDKTEADNWKLMERFPDYGTADAGDFLARRPICDHVREFECSLLRRNLIEIRLTLADGLNLVTLKTRALARYEKEK